MVRTVRTLARARRHLALGAAVLGIATLVAACSSGDSATPSTAPANAGGGDVTGTWQLVAISTREEETVVPAAAQDRYVITFAEDGTAEIKADCNRIRAQYETTSGGGITITLGPSTLVACPEDSLGPAFADSLAVAETYTVDGDTLVVTDEDGGTLRLTAAS